MLYPTELQARSVIIATCSTRGKVGRGGCARDCARETARYVLKIGRTRDVVSVEHGPRSVPGDLHCYALWHASVDHVSNRRATKVVPQHPGHSRLPARRSPRLPVVTAPLSCPAAA